MSQTPAKIIDYAAGYSDGLEDACTRFDWEACTLGFLTGSLFCIIVAIIAYLSKGFSC